MQRATFLRTRTKKRIRILPRVPTLQTYSFWPIGVFQRRWLARYCSVPAFFCTDAQRRPLWSRTRKKSWVRILCREPGCRLCPFGQRHLKSTFPSNTNFAPFTARPARRGRLAPSPRRARRQGRHPSPRPPPAAVRAARAALRGYPGRARAQLHAPAPPDPRMLAIAPRLAPATPRRRAPPLGPSSRVPPVGLGRAGGGRCKGCTCVAPVPIFS